MIKVRNEVIEMKVSKWVIWVVFFVAIFVICYVATSVFVKAVMKDFKEPGLVLMGGEPIPTNVLVPNEPKLEVKENYGTQTDNHFNPQKTAPAKFFETADEYTVRVL